MIPVIASLMASVKMSTTVPVGAGITFRGAAMSLPYGGPVGGGSWAPTGSSSAYVSAPESAPAGAVTRGGFGGTGEGHSGGEGAGE
jgi:hypothetical protein